MNADIIFPSDQGVPVTPAAIAVIGCHKETASVHVVSITVTRKQPAFILRLNQVSLSQGSSQRSSCGSINSLSQGNSQRSSCGSIKYHCHKETASVHLAAQSTESSITATRKQPA